MIEKGAHGSILFASAETVDSSSLASTGLSANQSGHTQSRALLVWPMLALIFIAGFWLRANQLGAEGLSEDELNKFNAVQDYRAHGLTAANGEHPFLMKAMLTISVVAAERWNDSSIVKAEPSLRISTEAALRFPGALLGAFTSLLIFLVTTELFGTETALIAAVLWALDPSGIGFNRIAKEDGFLLFFFLLANVFWLRGRSAAEAGRQNPEKYYWASAAAFGAMLASKYVPHFLAISVSYYYIFQGLKRTRWRIGKRRWLIFFAVMGAAFLLCNPTILLPGTWHEMKIFAGEKRIGHDSYEFMGSLYRNQMTLWLKGSPWYFYFVFMAVKIPVPVLISFLIGLPLLFRKRLGVGRFLILFWMLYWFMPFTVMGGKFTRYFTMALPAVLITAALGINFIAQIASRLVSNFNDNQAFKSYVRGAIAATVLIFPAYASASVMPHYRLYTNALGGGWERAGDYFPHDEFYDASVREAVAEIASSAPSGARIANETPMLITYYAQLAGRSDLVSLSLSDHVAMKNLSAGDYVIIARGRRYFSNDALIKILQESAHPVKNLSLGRVPSLQIFILDQATLETISETLR